MTTVSTREDFLRECKKMLPDNCLVAELGVLEGDFSRMILNIINPLELTLVDPYARGGDPYGTDELDICTAYSNDEQYKNLLFRFIDEIHSRQVEVVRNFSYNAAKLFGDAYFDGVYIDASHLYKDVKRDLNDWLPLMKDEHLLMGHDYVDFSNFGVKQAVNEFMEEYNYKMVVYNELGGDWALKRKS